MTTPTTHGQVPEALIYAELPKHAATGLGEEYESFDQNGKPMGKAYQNLVYYTEDQMRAFADATHALRTQQPAPATQQAGWAWVPVEPTQEMLSDAMNAFTTASASLGAFSAPEAAYRAMLAAAPTPAAQGDAPELDAWQCERCHGKGWHWQSEAVNHGKEIGIENVDLKTHCDACEGIGWCGYDAERAALAQKEVTP